MAAEEEQRVSTQLDAPPLLFLSRSYLRRHHRHWGQVAAHRCCFAVWWMLCKRRA